MDLQSDVCFALDCFRFVAWTIIILASSALLTWLLIFHKENKIGFFVKVKGWILFLISITFQLLTALAFHYWWPNFTELFFTAIWGLILAYSAWEVILEPLFFRIGQWRARIFGF